MSELKMSKPAGDKDFEIHPEGTFMAVCRDIWIERKPNPKAGQMNKWGNKEKDEIVRLIIEFLTDEPIEIGGKMMPRFAAYRPSLSWHEDSNLRKFIRGWNPALGKDDEADLQVLVGKGAYLTISHNVGSDGKTYANVMSASAPPKGATIPMVPPEFIRHKDRDAAAPASERAAIDSIREGDSDMPF